MAKCPKCSQEINKLHMFDFHAGDYALDQNGNGEIVRDGLIFELCYSCPKCHEKIDSLTNRPDLAANFLKTGKLFIEKI